MLFLLAGIILIIIGIIFADDTCGASAILSMIGAILLVVAFFGMISYDETIENITYEKVISVNGFLVDKNGYSVTENNTIHKCHSLSYITDKDVNFLWIKRYTVVKTARHKNLITFKNEDKEENSMLLFNQKYIEEIKKKLDSY